MVPEAVPANLQRMFVSGGNWPHSRHRAWQRKMTTYEPLAARAARKRKRRPDLTVGRLRITRKGDPLC